MGRIAVSAGGSPGGDSWGDGSQPLAMGCVVSETPAPPSCWFGDVTMNDCE
jgi:hypothetical protein